MGTEYFYNPVVGMLPIGSRARRSASRFAVARPLTRVGYRTVVVVVVRWCGVRGRGRRRFGCVGISVGRGGGICPRRDDPKIMGTINLGISSLAQALPTNRSLRRAVPKAAELVSFIVERCDGEESAEGKGKG